jgi:hypothetical protein
MARSLRSFSELQSQFIGAELGRRHADSRKEAVSEWHAAGSEDIATDPPRSPEHIDRPETS